MSAISPANASPIPIRLSDLADFIHAPSPEAPLDHEPDLIVLCAYMDSKLRHLRSFIQPYHRILPRTPILVVYSRMSLYFRSNSSCQADLVPVARYIESLKPQRIHGHVLSNGGAFQLVILGQVLRDRMASADVLSWHRPHPFPLQSILFDSTPGSNTIAEARASFGAGMKSPSQPRLLHLGIDLQCILCATLIQGADLLPRVRVYQSLLKHYLLDPTIIPQSAKRVYVYSKEDKLVRWQAVEAHVDQVRRAGCDVKTELWVASQHVQHVKKEPERYWEIVHALLKSVGRRQAKL